MEITERQGQLLNKIVQDYISSAMPVSSEFLEKKHRLKVSPATIRNEMQRLTHEGYLEQPHTSAGRIPTDKGYRFFVNQIFGDNNEDKTKKRDYYFSAKTDKELNRIIKDQAKEREREISNLVKNFTEIIAKLSSSLVLTYLLKERVCWREGWEEILKMPEFQEADFLKQFIIMTDTLEEDFTEEDFFSEDSFVDVYIGKENPVKKARSFSTIISKCCFPDRHQCVIAILGPKRMAYEKNISLVNSAVEFLNEY